MEGSCKSTLLDLRGLVTGLDNMLVGALLAAEYNLKSDRGELRKKLRGNNKDYKDKRGWFTWEEEIQDRIGQSTRINDVEGVEEQQRKTNHHKILRKEEKKSIKKRFNANQHLDRSGMWEWVKERMCRHSTTSLSQSNPKEDPLVLWLTDCPNCSAFSGLTLEIGHTHYSFML
ncbi:hypothetical protein VNO77_39330 [Canavalia gladiata]|uniref:Uncharacterized protein n=1 Tax=Canavalia gladiata TaxID=3824 RepID=A0AAN9PVQ3_CANGL